jgi:hypothetical protein
MKVRPVIGNLQGQEFRSCRSSGVAELKKKDLFRFLELLAPGLRMIPEMGVLVLENWRIGVLEYWSIGVLEYWSIEAGICLLFIL